MAQYLTEMELRTLSVWAQGNEPSDTATRQKVLRALGELRQLREREAEVRYMHGLEEMTG